MKCSILFRDRWTASKPSLEHSIASVDPDKLSAEYEALRKNAPRRHDVGKAYFVEHRGAPSSGGQQQPAGGTLRNGTLESRLPLAAARWRPASLSRLPGAAQSQAGGLPYRQDRSPRRHGPRQVDCRRVEVSVQRARRFASNTL